MTAATTVSLKRQDLIAFRTDIAQQIQEYHAMHITIRVQRRK